MYLRNVQLGIQDLAGHPWLLHACAICAAIRFLRMGFDAFSCCTAVLSLASARKTPEHQQVSVEDPGCVR